MANVNDIIIRLRAEGQDQTAAALQEAAKHLGNLQNVSKLTLNTTRDLGQTVVNTSTSVSAAAKSFDDLSTSVSVTNKAGRRFRMEYLSVLFIAQNLNRHLISLARTSITTFTDIAGESNRTNQAFAAMSANITFLRFSIGQAIGQALVPLLPAITGIFEKLVDFIDKHPEGVAGVIIGGIVGLTALVGFAQLQLLLSGFGLNLATIFTSLTGISALLAAGLGFFFVYEGLKNFTEGDVLSGIGGILSAFGIFAKGPAGVYLLSIGIGLTLLGVLSGEEFSLDEQLAVALGSAYLGMRVGGPGGAVIALAAALVLTEIMGGDLIKSILRSGLQGTGGLIENVDEFLWGPQGSGQEGSQFFKDWAANLQRDIDGVGVSIDTISAEHIPNLQAQSNVAFSSMAMGLDNTEQGYIDMASVSVAEVDRINQALNSIPASITTTHYIRTVYV